MRSSSSSASSSSSSSKMDWALTFCFFFFSLGTRTSSKSPSDKEERELASESEELSSRANAARLVVLDEEPAGLAVASRASKRVGFRGGAVSLVVLRLSLPLGLAFLRFAGGTSGTFVEAVCSWGWGSLLLLSSSFTCVLSFCFFLETGTSSKSPSDRDERELESLSEFSSSANAARLVLDEEAGLAVASRASKRVGLRGGAVNLEMLRLSSVPFLRFAPFFCSVLAGEVGMGDSSRTRLRGK
ncbi:hypothetical protein QBC45DRAFT_417539 [Copromyces sp. CBS 386.78]|nr:hypothetical protein QBC45DRAFT_417539 [Copromyces sp. CBS 386.78]